jgi:cysteine desulfurase
MGNPSSVHQEGRRTRLIVEQARRDVAALVNAKPEHVVFTSGATEAANMVLTPLFRMGRSSLRVAMLYAGATEHPCIASGGRFAKDSVKTVRVLPDGRIDLDRLAEALAGHDASHGVPLIAVQAANNETGVIQPVQEIAAIVKAHGGLLVVDAVQTTERISVDISEGYGDFLLLSAHKMGGPKGVGALIAASDLVMPEPLIGGGGQERGHRSGTEAVALMAGFGAAATATAAALPMAGQLRALRDRLETGLKSLDPGIVIYGENAPRLPNTTFFSLPELKAETAQIAYDLAGIAVSAGSACSSGRVGASHVLRAMGVGDDVGAIRVSTGHHNSAADIDAFLAATRTLLDRRTRKNAAA